MRSSGLMWMALAADIGAAIVDSCACAPTHGCLIAQAIYEGASEGAAAVVKEPTAHGSLAALFPTAAYYRLEPLLGAQEAVTLHTASPSRPFVINA